MAKQKFEQLAPVEESTLTPAAEKRRPDPKPLQRAWGALGAATGSALLATIVGPMVASATGGFSLDGAAVTDDNGTTSGSVEASPSYVYLAPGEVAPDGAPVVQLDPITVVTSPAPGSTVVQVKPKAKVVYIYLKPGEALQPAQLFNRRARLPLQLQHQQRVAQRQPLAQWRHLDLWLRRDRQRHPLW